MDGINSSAQNSLNLSLYVIRRIHENNSMIQTNRYKFTVNAKAKFTVNAKAKFTEYIKGFREVIDKTVTLDTFIGKIRVFLH